LLEQLFERSLAFLVHAARHEGLLELNDVPLFNIESSNAFLDLALPQFGKLILADKIDDVSCLLVSEDVKSF